MRRVRVLVPGTATALFLSLALASAAAAGTGSISGNVTDSQGHNALSGIRVCADELGSGGEVEPCASTDSAGHYMLSELPNGEWSVRFEAPPDQNLARQFYDDAVLFDDAHILLTNGNSITGINAEMHEGGTITGAVTDSETGLPIGGLEVCAEADGGLISVCRLSDGGGNYVITGLPGGHEYQVEFFSINDLNYLRQTYDGHQESFNGGDPVPVAVGGTASGIDAEMNPGAQIAGHLTDVQTGGPAVGIDVCALDPAPTPRAEEFEACGRSDAAGNYVIRAIRAGTFIVGFDREYLPFGPSYQRFWGGDGSRANAETITIAPPETKSGIDASLVIPHYDPEPEPKLQQPPLPPERVVIDCAKQYRRVIRDGTARCVSRHKRHKRHKRRPHRSHP